MQDGRNDKYLFEMNSIVYRKRPSGRVPSSSRDNRPPAPQHGGNCLSSHFRWQRPPRRGVGRADRPLQRTGPGHCAVGSPCPDRIGSVVRIESARHHSCLCGRHIPGPLRRKRQQASPLVLSMASRGPLASVRRISSVDRLRFIFGRNRKGADRSWRKKKNAVALFR